MPIAKPPAEWHAGLASLWLPAGPHPARSRAMTGDSGKKAIASPFIAHRLHPHP
ncbi:MAG: hypothetical protein HUU23_18010 [Caldilineales bacterium]|nr:hypothetical protein [Caldilineales bacterium]